MIKHLLFLLLCVNLFSLDTNTSKTASLHDDPLFQPSRENGITLYDALNEAIANSPKIKATKQYIIQNNASLDEAYGDYLPVVNFSGDAGYENRQYKDDPKNSDNAPVTQVLKYKKTDLYLTITENLWAGGSIQDIVDEKKAMLAMANYDYRNQLEKLVLDVTQAYFDVVYGEIALKIAEKNMKNYEKILKIVTIKEQNGAATKGDVNFIKANVENAKTELVLRQKTLQNAISNYTYLLSSDEERVMPFETASVLYHEDLNSSLKDAQQNNSKLLKQRAYIKATKFKFLSTRGKFAPKVDLSINAESRNEFDKGIGQREKVNALLTFNYNLYNGGKDEAAAARLLAKMREQRFLADDIRRKLIYDIQVLHQSVSSTEDSLKLTESEVLSSREVVKSYWISFQHGTQDLQALQLAQRNLNRAEQDYANYKKELTLNSFQLMQKTGVLLKFIKLRYKMSQEEMDGEFNLFLDPDEI
ncbi:MAG: TolC family protein [Sulfurimonas sp.]